ncbi:MAG: AAA family ATPase [Muribaculum sp.]|nr:AAA family ATPase [Muribaculum sp.]
MEDYQIKYLNIQNFRCFQDLHVDFTTGINLFIGDNASGKTSLLMACKYVINCFFSGFSDKYTTWVTPNKNDFTKFYTGEKRLSSKPIDIQFSFYGLDLSNNNADESRLTKKDKKNSRPLISLLRGLRDYGRSLVNNQIKEGNNNIFFQPDALPLIASFSTHGIHHSQKINSKYFTDSAQTPSFGYYMCHSTDGLLNHWVRRMLVLTEADTNPIERAIVLDALNRAFGSDGCNIFQGFDVRINYKDIICKLVDGREIPVSLLSDGYKRIFNIVIDLAFRCALLNSLKYGHDAISKTCGTVIIDEIDLHLHPSLQATILKSLRKTFPNIQFIVSTHAPMVMTGVESDDHNQVVYLQFNDNRYSLSTVDTYGMDLSTVATSILQVPDREPSVQKQITELQKLMDDEDFTAAKKLLNKLQLQFGDRIPELSGISTQLTIEEALL